MEKGKKMTCKCKSDVYEDLATRTEQLRQANYELTQANLTIELLQIRLESLANLASECDSWESFPQEALDDAYELLKATNN